MSRIIALLTDFGTTDTYVGVMKGVMLGICPDIQFVDLTHAIQPQNVGQAARALHYNYRYFPAETIFLVVVDPGVGSERKPIAARAGYFSFVAPDNGVLSYVLRDWSDVKVVQLKTPDQRGRVSNTFHGRDIFAPAAAQLAAGVELESLGTPVDHPVELPELLPVITDKYTSGEVVQIDHFGNVITNIGVLRWIGTDWLALKPPFRDSKDMLQNWRDTINRIFARKTKPPFRDDDDALYLQVGQHTVIVAKQHVQVIAQTYADVAPGEVLALVSSDGYLELAVNGGSFAERFGVKIGDPVELLWDKRIG